MLLCRLGEEYFYERKRDLLDLPLFNNIRFTERVIILEYV